MIEPRGASFFSGLLLFGLKRAVRNSKFVFIEKKKFGGGITFGIDYWMFRLAAAVAKSAMSIWPLKL